MLLIQIFFALFFLLAIVLVVKRWRVGALSSWLAVIWIIFWLAAIAVVLRPDATFVLARFLGVGRGADAVVYLALVLLFYLQFRFLMRLEKMEQSITKLTRAVALRDEKSKF